MKELTIEQKAKAYDEAIKRGLDYIRHTPATEMVTRQDIFEAIFPEFKEPEDVKIRKEFCKDIWTFIPNEKANKYIAWLDKQKPVSITDEWIEDYWQHEKVINMDSYDKSEEIQFDHQGFVNFCKKYCQKPVEGNKEDVFAWLEKQGEHKPYGQRKECEDCQFNYAGECKGFCQMKRDEQEPVDEAEPKFHIGDKIRIFRKGAANEEPMTITKIDGKGYWSGDLFLCNFTDADRLKLVEQKPADKIEPKFKPGDTMRTLQEANDGYTDGMPVVVSIDNEYYHCTNELIAIKDQDDYEFPPINVKQKSSDEVEPKFHEGEWLQYRNAKPFFVEEITKQGYVNGDSCLPFEWEDEIHLWTIRDAKCGDVLISSNKQPFVYNGNYTSDSLGRGRLGAYFGLNYHGELLITDSHGNNWSDLTGVQPATEEQRNTLFKKLHDSDYKWDSEKKELWHKYL